MAVGLSILLADQTYGSSHPNQSPHLEQQHMIKMNNMFVVRPVIKLSQTMIVESIIEPPSSSSSSSSPIGGAELESDSYCYLKSCHLCHKKLQPEDDIYMYKGDQGYCTEECRSKQIKMDKAEEEKEERQAYITNLALKRELRMMRHQNSAKCNETLSILRDLRHRGRRGPVHLQRNGAIFF